MLAHGGPEDLHGPVGVQLLHLTRVPSPDLFILKMGTLHFKNYSLKVDDVSILNNQQSY